MKENIIPLFDSENIKDKIQTIQTVGKVKLYKNNELIDENNNLVVYIGREFAIQKVTNLSNPSADYRQYDITYFGIGSGGADPNDGTVLLGPNKNDTGLYSPIQISQSHPSPQYLDNGRLKQITSKEIILDGTTNKYTTAKFVLDIDPNTDDNISNISPYQLNEAALFAVNSSNNSFILFAHVCFPTKIFDTRDRVTIEWFILM